MTSESENRAPPLFRVDATTFQNPYPMFARVRAGEPVHRTPQGDFILTRYADLVSALKDPKLGRAGIEAAIQREQGLGDQRLFILPAMFADPPEHTRLRAVLNRSFTLRVVEALVPQIERVTNELLDRVRGQDSFDLITAVAYTLPISTICYLLGMPSERHERIHELAEAHAAALTTGGLRPETKDIIERANRLRLEWADYFRELAEKRREEPGNDLVSELVRVHDGTDKLTEYELLATIVGILFAGHTTTADTIGTGVLALLSHRDQWDLLVADRGLLDGAVEEVLRWDPAVQFFSRVALNDTEVAGVAIPKGANVLPLSGAANRDPAQFPDPDRFDIKRTPNRHVTFGSGIHFCLGSTLARVQIKTVLNALLERYPALTLRDATPTFRRNLVFRGLTRLDVNVA